MALTTAEQPWTSAHSFLLPENAVAAMEHLKEEPGIAGCIILSTCNRIGNLATSTTEDWQGSLYEFLCREKGKEPAEYAQYFAERTEEEAVEHLFYLTSGLKSQILAEDQIITQVKDALSLSREAYCTDNVLEVLFRMAVTAAKKVKTKVIFSRVQFRDSSSHSLPGGKGLFLVWQNLHGYRKRRNGQGGGAGS